MLRAAIFIDGENFRHTICDLFANPRGGEHLFDRRDYLPKQAQWAEFFSDLVQQSQVEGISSRLVRAYWYVVGAIDPWPDLPKMSRNPESGEHHYDLKQLDVWRTRNAEGIRNLVQYMGELPTPKKFSAKREGVEAILEELRWRKNAKEKEFAGQAKLQRAIVRKHRSIQFRRSGGIGYNLFTKRYGAEKTTDVNLAVDMVMLRNTYDIAVIVSGDQDFVPAAEAAKNLGKTVVNVAFKTNSGDLLPGGAKRLNEAVDWCVEVKYADFRKFLFPHAPPPLPSSSPLAPRAIRPTKKPPRIPAAPAPRR